MSSNRQIAEMYLRGRLRDGFDHARTAFFSQPGSKLAVRNGSLPPVAEYDRFVSLQLAKTRGKQTEMTGAKLRRIVIMRREGRSLRECGDAIGFRASPVLRWLNLLPAELGGAA